MLLESNLIKRLRPRYNILLRDDKSFPFILVTGDHAWPQITKHRGARSRKGEYFGPFASAGAVNRTLNTLQKAFPLRSCGDSIFESRTRPCLQYQIKRCLAPCVGRVGRQDYGGLVEQTRRFLSGRSREVQGELAERMAVASEALEFERAAALRDRLRALAHIQAHQGGNRAYFPSHGREASGPEVLAAFLGQFYDDKPPPKEVLLNLDIEGRALLAEALGVKAERRVRVHRPQRGNKRELVAQATANARDALARRLAENASQRRLLEEVAELFGLDGTPGRIEVYDNSHIQGANAIGAMIVAGPEGFRRNAYRKFNIKSQSLTPGDDYAMMREVLTRRFSRLIKAEAEEAGESEDGGGESQTQGQATGENRRVAGERPDLVMIDGGPGHLTAALEVFAELGIDDIALTAIAKGPDRNAGREHLYLAGRPPIVPSQRGATLYFLQRLRDEAHRFAIGTHRARRGKELIRSALDEIAGVGPRRKRALLNHFGSARGVEQAALADLESIAGVSKAVARRIYDFFHPDA